MDFDPRDYDDARDPLDTRDWDERDRGHVDENLDPNELSGTEDIGPEDTFDGDYGRLLERVYGKGSTFPMPASWNQIVPWLRQIDGLRRAA